MAMLTPQRLDQFLLRSAARQGDVEEIQRIMDDIGFDWSEEETVASGSTPFHEACRRGHTRVVEELFYRGFPWDTPDQHGRTPLILACENGQEAVVQLLLERGADPNQVVGYSGDTALHRVFTTSQNLAVAQRLIDAGADIERKNNRCETTIQAIGEAFHSIERDLDVLFCAMIPRRLIESYPCTDAERRFLVFLAEQNVAIKKGLVTLDAPIDVLRGFWDHDVCFVSMFSRRNILGRTVMDVIRSQYEGHGKDEADAFFRICGRSYLQRARSCPAQSLRSAASRGNLLDFQEAKSLFRENANAAAANSAGLTPLHFACIYGKAQTVSLLLDDGADLWTESINGQTPLALASEVGQLSVVKEILRRLICC